MSGPLFGDGPIANIIILFIHLWVWSKDNWGKILTAAIVIAALFFGGRAAFGQRINNPRLYDITLQAAQRGAQHADSVYADELAELTRTEVDIIGQQIISAPTQPHGLMFPESTKWWLLGMAVVSVGLLILVAGFSAGWW